MRDVCKREIIQTADCLKKMDADSTDILKGFSRSVVILGDRLPKWFDTVYADGAWDSVHLPELTNINTKTATSLMAKPDGKVHLDGITTIKDGVTTVDWNGGASPRETGHARFGSGSPQSLGHLTKHIETVRLDPYLGPRKGSSDSRYLWSHHQLRDRGDDGEGNRFVVPSPR